MKKHLMGLLVLFSLGFIVVLSILGRSFLVMTQDSYGASMMLRSQDLKFEAKNVQNITWVNHRVKQVLFRSPVSLLWNSAYGQEVIKKRLDFFSSLKGKKIGPLENIEGSLTLMFNDSREWKAVYNRHSLRWISGPFEGEGGRLNEKDAYVFATGKYLFKQGPLKWCEGDIKELKGEGHLSDKNLTAWQGSHCTTQIDYMLESHTSSYHQFSNQYNLTLQGDKKAVLKWNDKNLIFLHYPNRKLLFVSKVLREQLDKLSIAPIKGN